MLISVPVSVGELFDKISILDIKTKKIKNKNDLKLIKYELSKLRKIVKDKKISEELKPRSIVGCKRLVIESNYYDTFNRENVELINLKKNPINCINRRGIEIEGIGKINLDMIILATGFDAMTGALNNINIIGKNNITLKDKWINGPETYLGLAMNGFPNFFTITGPGSPSVLTNMIPTIEQHVDWIADCIRYIKKKSYHSIEANLDAEIEWGKYNDKCAHDTLRYYCDSWYLGSNVTGKKRVFYPFVGGLPVYIEKCEEIVNNSYEGFTLE